MLQLPVAPSPKVQFSVIGALTVQPVIVAEKVTVMPSFPTLGLPYPVGMNWLFDPTVQPVLACTLGMVLLPASNMMATITIGT